MEHTNKKKIYIILKVIIALLAILTLLFASNLWIGTEENWDEIIKDEFIPALLTRTIFLILLGLIFLGFSYMVDKIFKRKSFFSKELFILIIFSVSLNIIVMLS